MSKYRAVYQCDVCGKVYRNKYFLDSFTGISFTDCVCKKCGTVGRIYKTVGKPKMFGLCGWCIKNNKEEKC